MSRTALVLGAGLGGMVAAQALRRLLPKDDRVVLVEREARHVFPPSLLWLMVGARSAEAISRPVDHAARAGIELVRGEVSAIDPVAKTAVVNGATLRGDALVIALGAEYAPQAIPGLADAGLCIYTLEGATAIRAALEQFQGGRLVVLTATPAYKCPAAPYEAALLVENFLRQRGRRPCGLGGRVRDGRGARHRLPPRAPGEVGRREGAANLVRQRQVRGFRPSSLRAAAPRAGGGEGCRAHQRKRLDPG